MTLKTSPDPSAAPNGPNRSRGAFLRALRAPVLALPLCFALTALIGAADYATGYEVRLAVLYLLPIALATWACGRRWGLAMALLGPAIWIMSFAKDHPYKSHVFFVWENVVMGITFILVVELIARLQVARASLERQMTALLDQIPVAGYLADKDGRIRYANERLRSHLADGSFPARESAIAAAFEPLSGQARFEGRLPSGTVRSVRDGRCYLCRRDVASGLDDAAFELVLLTEDDARDTLRRLRASSR